MRFDVLYMAQNMKTVLLIDNRAFTLSKLYAAAETYLLRRRIGELCREHCSGCRESQPNQLAHMFVGCLDDWSDSVESHIQTAKSTVTSDCVKQLVDLLLSELHLPPADSSQTELYCDDAIYNFVLLQESLWPNLDNLFCKVYEEKILCLPSTLYSFSDL